jgi:pyrroline-5-carboxylate reductase
MGGALVRIWAKSSQGSGHHIVKPEEIFVVDPDEKARQAAEEAGVRTADHAEKEQFSDLDSVVIAVKPQILERAAADIAPLLPHGVLLVSIAAGTPIAKLEALFPRTSVVRAMPNRPAEIGQGATAFVAHPRVTEGQRERARALLEAGGVVVEVQNEALIDVVTALSGSGPAYVFALVEAMAAAAVAQGLSPELAETLARTTISGSGALLAASGESAGALRESVTSPGGTTEAALRVLRAADGLDALMARAIAAATARGRELGGG